MRSTPAVLLALACAAGCGNGESGGGGNSDGGNGTELACDDGADDDGDQLLDCDDPDCASAPACAAPNSFDVTDPQDLPAPDGDPSLDIAKVAVTVAGTTVTTEISFYGTWPPDPAIYSWFVDLVYKANNVPAFTVTPQRNDGTSEILSNLPSSRYTILESAQSVKIVVTGVTMPVTHVLVQSSVKKTASGTRVFDYVPETALPK